MVVCHVDLPVAKSRTQEKTKVEKHRPQQQWSPKYNFSGLGIARLAQIWRVERACW